MPIMRQVSGKVAVVTGGASGIGEACCRRRWRAKARRSSSPISTTRWARRSSSASPRRAAGRTICTTTCATRQRGPASSPRPRKRLRPPRHHGGQCRHRRHGADRDHDAWPTGSVSRRSTSTACSCRSGTRSRRCGVPGRRLDRADVVDCRLCAAHQGSPPIPRPRAACGCSPSRWRSSMPPTTSAATRCIPASSPRRSGARSRLAPRAIAVTPPIDPRERAAIAVPLTRVGEAQDIANGVLFLCTEAANYMTGQEMVIDGGMTAGTAGAADVVVVRHSAQGVRDATSRTCAVFARSSSSTASFPARSPFSKRARRSRSERA